MGASHIVIILAGLQPPSGLHQVSPQVDHGELKLGGYFKYVTISIKIKFFYFSGHF